MASKTPQKRVLFARLPKTVTTVLFAVFVAGLLMIGLVGKTAYAVTNPTVNFQARLMSSAGAIVSDGSYNVEFKLYSASSGGTALWSEDWLNNASQGISVTNGYLTASLGSVNAFVNATTPIPWGSSLWLTMNIGGTTSGAPSWDGEMSPRLPLTAVPSALALTSSNASGFVSTLGFTAPTANTSILLPATSSSTVNVCYQNDANCGFLSSSSGVQLQATSPGTPQTGNINVSGVIIAGSLQAASLDTAGTLSLGNSNATAVNIGNATAATTISLQGGTTATAIGLTAAAGGSINQTTTGAGKINLNSATQIVAKITASQVTGFQIQNSGGTALLDADTQNTRIGINTIAPGYTLDVTGDINTSSVLRVAGTDVCDTTGATGCIAKSGSGFYIHNQATVQTGASFYIQGGSSVVTGTLEANGADVLDLQNSSAVPVVTFSSTGSTLIKPSTSSTTALQIQNATTTADVVDADTTNDFFGINTGSPSANLQVNQSTLAPGTVTNSASSASVTGTSTTFTTTFTVGDTFTVTSTTNTCTISAITDNTHLTCASNLTNAATNSAYTTANVARFIVQNNGNVGVGTSSPTRTVDIATNNNLFNAPQVLIEQAGTGDASLQFKTSTKNWTIGVNASNSSSFSINSSTAANNATLGNPGVSSTPDTTDQNRMECSLFTASSSGTATSISVKVGTAPPVSPSNNFAMAVYTGTASGPTTLVTSTTTGTISGIGINTLPISFSIVNGTIYWLCANNNSNSGTASNWDYDTVSNAGWTQAFTFGSWAVSPSGALENQKFGYYVSYTPTGSFNSFTSTLFNLSDTGQLTLQNSADSTSELAIQNAAGNSLLAVASSSSTVSLGSTGTTALASTVLVGTSTGATQTIDIGSATSGSAANGTTVLIQGGNGASAVSIQSLASGTINVGTTGVANTIQIGNTTGAVTQTINIGNNGTGSATTNVTIGSTTSAAGTTTLQATTSVSIVTTASTSVSTGGISIQSGNATTGTNLNAGTVGIDTGTFTGTGSATINLGNTNAKTINIGTAGSNARTITIGSTTASSTTAIQAAGGVSINNSVNATTNINANTSTGAVNIGNSSDTNNINITSGTGQTVIQATVIPLYLNSTSGTDQESAILYELGGTPKGEIGVTGSLNKIINQTVANDLAIKSISGNVWIAAGGNVGSVKVASSDGSLGVYSTSTSALSITNATGSATVFTVDTTDQQVIIGNGTFDPVSGVAGAMYYNSSTNQFRCYNTHWENCEGLDSDAFRQDPLYATDFLDAGPSISSTNVDAAAPWTGYIIGAGGGVAGGSISTQDSNHPGVVRLNGGTVANSGFRYALNGLGMSLGGGESFELTFNLDTTSGDQVCIGFFQGSNCTNSNSPVNGVWAYINGSNLKGETQTASNTVTATGTSTTLTAGTWYRMKIVVSTTSLATFSLYASGSSTAAWTDTISTNIPTGTNRLGPSVNATNTGTGSSAIVDLDYMAVWWANALTR